MSAHRATDPCRNRGRRATDAGGDRANGARSASHAGRRAFTGSHRRHACRAQGDVAVDAGGPWHPEVTLPPMPSMSIPGVPTIPFLAPPPKA